MSLKFWDKHVKSDCGLSSWACRWRYGTTVFTIALVSTAALTVRKQLCLIALMCCSSIWKRINSENSRQWKFSVSKRETFGLVVWARAYCFILVPLLWTKRQRSALGGNQCFFLCKRVTGRLLLLALCRFLWQVLLGTKTQMRKCDTSLIIPSTAKQNIQRGNHGVSKWRWEQGRKWNRGECLSLPT